MRTHAFLILSGSLFVGLAATPQGMRFDSSELLHVTNFPRVSAHTEQTDEISPHRGSGRREAAAKKFQPYTAWAEISAASDCSWLESS